MNQQKDWSYEKTFLHAIIEKKAQTLKYGNITVYVFLKNSEPQLKTLKVVGSKRRKYNRINDNKPNLLTSKDRV